MKKIVTIVALIVGGLSTIGCWDEKCQRYAPDNCEISWTDYNTVKRVWDYLGCYSGTYEAHIGDTFKVKGYPLRYAAQTGPFEYDSNSRSFGFFFGDNWKKPYNQQTEVMIIDGDSSVMSCFRDYSWGRKVYLTVVLTSDREPWCCDYPDAEVINVKFEEEKK